MFGHTLEKMKAAQYPFPAYLHEKTADYSPQHYPQTSRADVFLSALKIHCNNDSAAIKAQRLTSVKEAAARYGIEKDITDMEDWLSARQKQAQTEKIETEEDWYNAYTWIQRNEPELKAQQIQKVAEFLLNIYPELDFVPKRESIVYLEKCAGVDNFTRLYQKAQSAEFCKLASGSVYSYSQFNKLSADDLQKVIPQLLKKAYCGLPAIQPELLAKAAEGLSENEAYVLDRLFETVGEKPVRQEAPPTIIVTDEALASL